MQDKIYDMLIKEDEITWQTIIQDLIKSEEMNPWDIDITLLTKRYLNTLKQLKEANFFISGKVLLAAAILLKIKTNKLVNEDFAKFDLILNPPEEIEDLMEDYGYQKLNDEIIKEKPKLTIKTPLPRKRKVSLDDLMDALKKALEVNQRRVRRKLDAQKVDVTIPEKKVDITALIKDVYDKIINFFKTKKEVLTFTKLVPSERKEDKILTFIPLLHLDNQNKIDLKQEEHFGDISIEINNKVKV